MGLPLISAFVDLAYFQIPIGQYLICDPSIHEVVHSSGIDKEYSVVADKTFFMGLCVAS